MTEADFHSWLTNAKAGDVLVYATHHSLGDKSVTDETLQVAYRAKLPPLPRQKDSEGKGYAPISKTTAKNTYTTNDGGTKRG